MTGGALAAFAAGVSAVCNGIGPAAERPGAITGLSAGAGAVTGRSGTGEMESDAAAALPTGVGAATPAKEVPHLGQNRASALQALPQVAQDRGAAGATLGAGAVNAAGSCCMVVPHFAQNRAPLLFSAWQFVQFTGISLSSQLHTPACPCRSESCCSLHRF